MGTEQTNKEITYIIIFKYAEEIKKLERNKPDSYIQEIFALFLSYIKSEDFIPIILINKENFLFDFFIMCEMGKEKDKYIFIKILFPLLEELKKLNFERQLWEANHIQKDELKSVLDLYYTKNKAIIDEKINMYTNNIKKPFEVLKNIMKNKSQMFGNYLSRMINVLFAYEEIVKKDIKGQNIIDEAYNFFKPYFYDIKQNKNCDISKLIEYLIELYPSLGSIKEIYNITMFAILKSIKEDEMKSIFGIYEKKTDFLTNIMNLKDNYTWYLFENYGKEPKTVSGQIKVKEEQVGINIFAIINSINKNKILYGYICQSLFINYDVIIIEINLYNYKHNKASLDTIKNELEKEIKRIQKSSKGYQNLNTYIHVDSEVILYPQCYDLFLQKLLEKKIISINQVPEEYRSIIDLSIKRNRNKTQFIPQKNEIKKEVINNKDDVNNDKSVTWIERVKNKLANNEGKNNEKNDKENNEKNDKENNEENDKENNEENNKNNENIDNNKIFSSKTFNFNNDNVNEKQFVGNNQKIQDIQNNVTDSLQVNQLKKELEKEKLKNQNLSEKIKKLENKITIENKKNKNLELKIKELNIEIDLLKEKYDKLKNLQEISGKMPIDNSEIRDSLYETVFEKEKEIKELRSKLSRYPLQLDDGDKLMSLIFTSADQVIHHSVICKNNELFSKVENRLYDDGFPEYKETENFFTFNGLKINKNKTVEENNIKNSDVVILNVIDDDD